MVQQQSNKGCSYLKGNKFTLSLTPKTEVILLLYCVKWTHTCVKTKQKKQTLQKHVITQVMWLFLNCRFSFCVDVIANPILSHHYLLRDIVYLLHLEPLMKQCYKLNRSDKLYVKTDNISGFDNISGLWQIMFVHKMSGLNLLWHQLSPCWLRAVSQSVEAGELCIIYFQLRRIHLKLWKQCLCYKVSFVSPDFFSPQNNSSPWYQQLNSMMLSSYMQFLPAWT